ncbi:E4 orf4 [Simian adenovirus A1139]|uniref:E4 orf4 n=2 Tax=Simian mastadenovirus B TaxID=1962299 RepID=H9AAD4_9ADEN|nr:E4 orf4 [Simian adenovirus A1139]AFD21928.1 E4 orf4 [Simian adenovirus A1163]
MSLPSLPPPPVCREPPACLAWLELAYATYLDVLRNIRLHGITLTPAAARILSGYREWLYFALNSERQRRAASRRRKEACWGRTWFCYQKWLWVSRVLAYDATRKTVSLQAGPVCPSPSTAL